MGSTFALSLLGGTTLSLLLGALGVDAPLLWWLVSLCVVLMTLGSAVWDRSVPAVAMTCAMTLTAAVPAMLFQNIILFAIAYLVLQGLSALVALTVLLHWPYLSPRR